MASVYAGIGSRQTPQHILEVMRGLGKHYAEQDVMLRSGGAAGADTAFEAGCLSGGTGHCEIFTASNCTVPDWAFKLAEEFHPNWPAVKRQGPYVMRLHARNSMILLGADGASPVDFVVCWTPGGTESGGTGQALRIAREYGIPVYNLGRPACLAKAKAKLGL